MTLREQKDDLFNRIREVFNVGRMITIRGPLRRLQPQRWDGQRCLARSFGWQ